MLIISISALIIAISALIIVKRMFIITKGSFTQIIRKYISIIILSYNDYANIIVHIYLHIYIYIIYTHEKFLEKVFESSQ